MGDIGEVVTITRTIAPKRAPVILPHEPAKVPELEPVLVPVRRSD